MTNVTGTTSRRFLCFRRLATASSSRSVARSPSAAMSTRTVETHRAHIQQKLRRTTRAELVRYALEHKLVG